MNRLTLLGFLLILVSAMSGCGQGAASTPPTETALIVEDQASLLAALQATGATAEIGDSAASMNTYDPGWISSHPDAVSIRKVPVPAPVTI